MTTKSRGQKHSLDKFYTQYDTVTKCLSVLNLENYDTVIEPSAGNGSFSNRMDCLAYDIEPEGDNIIEADWFKLDKTQFEGRVLVVGNPPFGQQNSLAVRFFNESTFADTIAFILPRTFRKDSIKNRLDLSFHLEKEVDLGVADFDMDGKVLSVPCVFQVWIKKDTPRKKKRLRTTTELFDFVDKSNADFRIQRVGGNAGKASFDLDYSTQSNYFVVNRTALTNEELVELINTTMFPGVTDTVGPKSVGKGELIAVLEDIIENLDI